MKRSTLKDKQERRRAKWTRDNNTPERKAYMREYNRSRARNRIGEANKIHAAEYRAANRARINGRARERTMMFKVSALMAYGWSCACCGEDRIEFLSIDHINGGGAKHRKELGGGGAGVLYRWLANNDFPDGFQVLCMNCNWARGIYGYCPHEAERSA